MLAKKVSWKKLEVKFWKNSKSELHEFTTSHLVSVYIFRAVRNLHKNCRSCQIFMKLYQSEVLYIYKASYNISFAYTTLKF